MLAMCQTASGQFKPDSSCLLHTGGGWGFSGLFEAAQKRAEQLKHLLQTKGCAWMFAGEEALIRSDVCQRAALGRGVGAAGSCEHGILLGKSKHVKGVCLMG